ncbi:DUF4440 domain-containing protein, partial [Kaarinaea lacus]
MDGISQRIKELEEILLQRHVRKDIEMLSTLLHDEFEEIGSSGDICTKSNAIRWLLREDDAIQWSLTEFRARRLTEDMVLATYC